ncbi:hypothetical protein BSNK01_22680 [Bacillaceae bacterium]
MLRENAIQKKAVEFVQILKKIMDFIEEGTEFVLLGERQGGPE